MRLCGADFLSGFALAAIVAFLTLPAILTDRVYLPQHPGAHDVPWRSHPGEDARDEPFNSAFSDKMNLLFPDTVHGYSEARAGRFPEWNSLILGGVPHIANPLTSVFYPPNWLFLLVRERNPAAHPVDKAPLHRMLIIQAALHVLLAGSFFFLYLRSLGARSLPSLFGATAFAFSGWVAAHLQNTPLVAVVAWLPLGLFAIECRLRGGGRLWLMLLSLSVAMMWLAGMPQLAILGTLALFLSGAAGLIGQLGCAPAASIGRNAAGFLVFGAVGLLLSSIQLAPTLEILPFSGHQDRTGEDLVAESLRPGALAGAVLPRFLGDPTERIDPRDRYAARIVLGAGAGEAPRPNWSERTFYPGIIVLVLAAFGLFHLRGRALSSLLSLLLLGVALACVPWIIRLLAPIPAFSVGAPVRAVFLVSLALPGLAAFGFQALLDHGRGERSLRLATASFAIASAAAVAAVLFAFAFAFESKALELIVDFLKWCGVERRLGGTEVRPAEIYVEAFRGDFALLRKDLAFLAGWLAAAAAAFWMIRRRPAQSGFARAALFGIMAADLLAFFIPVNLPVRREGLFRETPAIRFLRNNLGDQRILRVSGSVEEALREADSLFKPNYGMLFGIRDAQGWREQIPRWYLRLWEGVAARTIDAGVSGIAAGQAGSPVLDLARVGFLVASREIPSLGDYEAFRPLPSHPRDLWIYRNPGAVPRAYVVHRARSLPESEALALLKSGEADFRTEVLLDRWPEGAEQSRYEEPATPASVVVEEAAPGRSTIQVATDSPGWLVVTDTWYPDWKATRTGADGVPVPVPVARAQVAFRAIPLQAGTQTIHLHYVPGSITAGGILTALGWIGFLLLPLVGSPGRRPHAPDSPRRPEPSAGGGSQP